MKDNKCTEIISVWVTPEIEQAFKKMKTDEAQLKFIEDYIDESKGDLK